MDLHLSSRNISIYGLLSFYMNTCFRWYAIEYAGILMDYRVCDIVLRSVHFYFCQIDVKCKLPFSVMKIEKNRYYVFVAHVDPQFQRK